MRVQSSVGLAVGPANGARWGQVLVMPTAYGIIEIDDPGGHAQQLGVAALSFLSEQLSRDCTSLQALEELADRIAPVGLRTLALLVPVGNIIYLVLRGKGAVYCKRGSELALLVREHGGISGEVKPGDTFILASAGFSSRLSHDELSGLFDHLSPIELAEKLTLLLHGQPGGEGMVALVFGISGFAQSEFEETVSPEPEEPSVINSDRPGGINNRIKAIIGALHDPDRFRRFFSVTRMKRFYRTLRENPKKRLRVFAVVAGIFFFGSVLLGVWKQTTMKKNTLLIAAMEQARHSLGEGVALSGLNPMKGRERLNQAKDTLAPFLSTVPKRSSEGLELDSLYKQITDNLSLAMQITKVPLTLFYDTSLLKKEAVASDIALTSDTLVVSDRATETVYAVTISSKNARIVGGGPLLSSVSSVAASGDTIYALTPSGIVLVNGAGNKSTRIIDKDTSWGFVSVLSAFGGNLYVLDTQKSRIWKYVATDTGFSEIREYLNPDTLPDVSLAASMAIDGSVWLGTTNGKIFRFAQGADAGFAAQGVEPVFGTKVSVFTNDGMKNVYVLDSVNKRVVVLDKTGMYLSQYQFDGTLIPTKLVVSEDAKLVLLLCEGKIYSLPLK